jgi:hypothetical protein
MFVVFLDPYQGTPKHALKKTQKKKSADRSVGLGFSKFTGGSVDFVWAAPPRGTQNKTDGPLRIFD